ncbi:MAG: STAS domain-containing protein [Solirubrobacterales bacterium]
MAAKEERSVNAGPLKLRMTQYGDTAMIQLSGELDLANAGAVERELQTALANDSGRVVLDLGDLDFIDSTGIALLVTVAGEDNGDGRVRFLRSRAAAVNRVLELTGVAERLPFVDAAPDADPSRIQAP